MHFVYLFIALAGAGIVLRGLYLLIAHKPKMGFAGLALGLVIVFVGCLGAASVWMSGWSEYTAEPDSEIARVKFAAAFDLPSNMLYNPGDPNSTPYLIPAAISNIWYGTRGFQDYIAFIRFDFEPEADLGPLLQGWTPAERLNVSPEYPDWWLTSPTEGMKIYTRATGSAPGSLRSQLIIDRENGVAYWTEE